MMNNNINSQNPYVQQKNPNAVEINIIAPQAYANAPCGVNPNAQNGFYSLYQPNQIAGNNIYPSNYNNMITYPQGMYPQYQQYPQNGYQQYPQNGYQQNPINNQNDDINNKRNLNSETNLVQKTENSESEKTDSKNKTKQVTPLTDDYIKSLENYLNNQNSKVRLIGAKEVLERFKEDENRKDNPSLTALLNKTLKDPSPSVRFLGLTALQLGYSVGNSETVQILKEIQSTNKDMSGEENLMASEILLNMSAGQKIDVPMTQNEIDKANSKDKKEK